MAIRRVLMIFGTRPEAIKMCPLAIEIKKNKMIECFICLTGQHKEMLKQVMEAFDIHEDYNLNIMKENQTLTDITSDILGKMEKILQKVKPDLVLVHGDTTSAFVAALAAFYQKIPVGHVEAGLRSGNRYSPYPEEMNRVLLDRICSYYFVPTKYNEGNLLKEGICENIYITGNTVIDAFKYTIRADYEFHNIVLQNFDFEKKRVILLTFHRRENWGESFESVCDAVVRLVRDNPDVWFIYPVHMNPIIRKSAIELLGNNKRILLIDPIDVLDMHNLLKKCYFVMTDSGGLQEEAPTLGKPVLVLREETERPEVVEAGVAKLVGTDSNGVYSDANRLLNNRKLYDKMKRDVSLYGDGQASEKIVRIIRDEL